jgi:hypothetical protein
LRVSFFLSLRVPPFPSLRVLLSPSLRGAKRRSNLLQQSVSANRRVGKCVGVKQSPHCTFLLVLSVSRGLLRSLRSLAMTVWGCRLAMTNEVFARNDALFRHCEE